MDAEVTVLPVPGGPAYVPESLLSCAVANQYELRLRSAAEHNGYTAPCYLGTGRVCVAIRASVLVRMPAIGDLYRRNAPWMRLSGACSTACTALTCE